MWTSKKTIHVHLHKIPWILYLAKPPRYWYKKWINHIYVSESFKFFEMNNHKTFLKFNTQFSKHLIPYYLATCLHSLYLVSYQVTNTTNLSYPHTQIMILVWFFRMFKLNKPKKFVKSNTQFPKHLITFLYSVSMSNTRQ